MSGVPSWAFREPSTKRTAEWTTLCGWMTTSIASSSTSYSQRASTTSRPLFARVAESIVIFAPIDQVGWRRACSRGDRRQVGRAVEERPARRGQDERRDPAPSTRRRGTARSRSARSRSGGARRAGWRTDRRVDGRPFGGARAGRAPSRGGRRRRASPCWPSRRPCRRERGEDGPEADDPAGRDDDQVDVVARSAISRQRLAVRPPTIATRGAGNARPARQARRLSPAASATTSNTSGCAARTSSVWRPDRARRAEDRDPQSRARLSGDAARAYRASTGAANRNESTRSRTPP